MAQDITSVTDRDSLSAELRRERGRQGRKASAKSTIVVIVAAIAVAAVIATMFLPVLRIEGASMSSTLNDGDVALAIKDGRYETGDVVAFYHNNDILIKRVIANAGQWVDIGEDGAVYVDGKRLDEPYVTNQSRGECTIELPYQVPEGRIFVMGDHRDTSIDSRSTQVGSVRQELVIGKILLRLWPLGGLGSPSTKRGS